MRRGVLAALAILFGTLSAFAQDWPTKSVRIIVPFGAGATPDLVARLIADYLHDKLGQAFIVENKPGASGNTGTDAVAKAEPDGSTIGVSIGGPLAINTLLFSKLPYDPKKDLALITMLVTHAERACGQCQPRREEHGGADRPDQAQSGQIRLRLDRHRLAVAACHGGDRAQGRHQARPRPLPVVAAGDPGADAQRRADGLPAGDLHHAATRRRRHQDARGLDRRSARRCCPTCRR